MPSLTSNLMAARTRMRNWRRMSSVLPRRTKPILIRGKGSERCGLCVVSDLCLALYWQWGPWACWVERHRLPVVRYQNFLRCFGQIQRLMQEGKCLRCGWGGGQLSPHLIHNLLDSSGLLLCQLLQHADEQHSQDGVFRLHLLNALLRHPGKPAYLFPL